MRHVQDETKDKEDVISPSFGDDKSHDVELWIDRETHEIVSRRTDERPDPDTVVATKMAIEGFFYY